MGKRIQETNNWRYRGEELTSLSQVPEGAYGFIYLITNNLTGTRYVGKKCLYSFHKEVVRVPGKGKRTRKQVNVTSTEADWQRYWGSNIDLKAEIKKYGKESYTKEILYFAYSKAQLTYYETKELFARGVLEPDSNYINDNILGKFYRKIFHNDSESQDEKEGSGLEEQDIE